jgi:hypothetical protein
VTIAPTPAIPVALTVTYTMAGVEKIAGEECVKIKASVVSDKAARRSGDRAWLWYDGLSVG